MDDFNKWLLKEIIDDPKILPVKWINEMREKFEANNTESKISFEKIIPKKISSKTPRMNYRSNEVDCWIIIASFLSPIDLVKIGRVCKDWYRWSRSDICWKHHKDRILKSYPELLSIFQNNNIRNGPTCKYIDMIPSLKYREDDEKRKVFKDVKGTWYVFNNYLFPIWEVSKDSHYNTGLLIYKQIRMNEKVSFDKSFCRDIIPFPINNIKNEYNLYTITYVDISIKTRILENYSFGNMFSEELGHFPNICKCIFNIL